VTSDNSTPLLSTRSALLCSCCYAYVAAERGEGRGHQNVLSEGPDLLPPTMSDHSARRHAQRELQIPRKSASEERSDEFIIF
jgi:hypothetical protein